MKSGLRPVFMATALLAVASHPLADDTATLLCTFEHGQIEVSVNYTRQTVNGSTAMLSNKEIIWTPRDEKDGLAVIDRFTGLMRISKGSQEFIGMCNRKPVSKP